MCYLYILYNSIADKYYVGHSRNPWERLVQHNSNTGDKFTGKYADWILKAVFQVSPGKGDADRLEKFIKRQKSRQLVEKLTDTTFVPTGKLSCLIRVPQLKELAGNIPAPESIHML